MLQNLHSGLGFRFCGLCTFIRSSEAVCKRIITAASVFLGRGLMGRLKILEGNLQGLTSSYSYLLAGLGHCCKWQRAVCKQSPLYIQVFEQDQSKHSRAKLITLQNLEHSGAGFSFREVDYSSGNKKTLPSLLGRGLMSRLKKLEQGNLQGFHHTLSPLRVRPLLQVVKEQCAQIPLYLLTFEQDQNKDSRAALITLQNLETLGCRCQFCGVDYGSGNKKHYLLFWGRD